MSIHYIKKGLDIALDGLAEARVETFTAAKTIALQPQDFPYIAWRLAVNEGDDVQIGSPVLVAKEDESLILTSTVSGKVKAIVRGERRALLRVEIESDGQNSAVEHGALSDDQIHGIELEVLCAKLKALGVWPLIRQRPFEKVADFNKLPKAIFINAMDTAPLAAQQAVILQNHQEFLQKGIDILKRFCKDIHLVSAVKDQSFEKYQRVQHQKFDGPHPAGLIGTHIAKVSPLNRGDVVWYLTAEHAALIGEAISKGITPTQTIVAVAGSKALRQQYFTITRHSAVADFAEIQWEDTRIISGNVLTGNSIGKEGFVGFYDSLISCIPEGGQQHYISEDQHWTGPGFKSFSTFRLFASKIFGNKKWNLNTSLNGGERAIILTENYERFVPHDIEVGFLLKAIIAEDIDEMEKLGLLELAPEDVALCTFACPSKVEVAEIVRQGLNILEKEG